MTEKEQVKPLAPTALRLDIDEDEALSMEFRHHQQRKYVKCCGCVAAILLIQAVIILVLIFTVFRVKDPRLRMNSVRIEGLNSLTRSDRTSSTNLTVIADVAVKNPNVASFKYNEATTNVYYNGVAVGEARTIPGFARARRTLLMNVTIDVMLEKLLSVPGLQRDLRLERIPFSSYTRISGKVKILKIIKKNVVVRLNCTMIVDIRSQSIEDQDCKRHVSI